MSKHVEPILQPDNSRFVIFPIQHRDLWDLYKQQQSSFWVTEEIPLDEDLFDWNNKLTDNEKSFIENILAFFAASDGIVNENLAENFISEVQYAEAKFFYGFQIMMENIHSETYSQLIDTYITDESRKTELFNALELVPAVQKKAEWALRWITKGSFAERLVAFSAVEGIFFSGSFCAIYWLKSRQLMPGLCLANELISRDEGLHKDFAVHLYNHHLENQLDPEVLRSILLDALVIEIEFITVSLPCRLLGINSDSMIQYLKFVVDELLVSYKLEKEFNVTQPFEFMNQIAAPRKTNFFEKKVTEYKKGDISSGLTQVEDF